MDRVDRFAMAGVIGALVILASFICYAFMPSPAFIFTFILGIVCLIGGYLQVRREHKAAIALSEAEAESESGIQEPLTADPEASNKEVEGSAPVEELR